MYVQVINTMFWRLTQFFILFLYLYCIWRSGIRQLFKDETSLHALIPCSAFHPLLKISHIPRTAVQYWDAIIRRFLASLFNINTAANDFSSLSYYTSWTSIPFPFAFFLLFIGFVSDLSFVYYQILMFVKCSDKLSAFECQTYLFWVLMRSP